MIQTVDILAGVPDHVFTTQWAGVAVQLEMHWNAIAGYWTFTLTRLDTETLLLAGIPLVCGIDLLGPYQLGLGRLVGASVGGTNPTLDNIGTDVIFYWTDENTSVSNGDVAPVPTLYTVGSLFYPLITTPTLGGGLYMRIADLPATNYRATGAMSFGLSVMMSIPLASSAQVRLYDATNHTTIYESTIVAGPSLGIDTGAPSIALLDAPIVLELWVASPTDVGGKALCVSAGITARFS
jgi:hypothetical protein